MAQRSDVGLCTGKDCRKADGFRTTERELRRIGDVRSLPCLDVCDGPVVVLDVRSDLPVVIERVRNRAVARELVAHIVDGDELTPRLRKRMLTGSKRAKARRRITRELTVGAALGGDLRGSAIQRDPTASAHSVAPSTRTSTRTSTVHLATWSRNSTPSSRPTTSRRQCSTSQRCAFTQARTARFSRRRRLSRVRCRRRRRRRARRAWRSCGGR